MKKEFGYQSGITSATHHERRRLWRRQRYQSTEGDSRMQRMIEELTLKFGSSPSEPPLQFSPGPVTVFVGPNNSGKSLLLREVEAFSELDETEGYEGTRTIEDFLVVKWVEPLMPSTEDARELLLSRQYRGDPELTNYYGNVMEGYMLIGKPILSEDYTSSRPSIQIQQVILNDLLSDLRSAYEDPSELTQNAELRAAVFASFVSLFTVRLDGGVRLGLLRERVAGPRTRRAYNHLQALFQDNDARNRLRSITHGAFGRYFTIDPTDMRVLRVRMPTEVPPTGIEESLDQEAQEFFGRATNIADLSDGVKAFTGLVATVLSSDYRIMLIDEPEAFLHPVLARKLGRHLTEIASERQGRVLAATHSPDFLIGCVEAGEVNVVRLTYQDDGTNQRATARRLPSSTLKQMMADPLLRSTGILSGLFHEGVVVSESDTDRAMYQEVNERLSEKDRTGAKNTLFVNAHEKSSVRRIVRPLREMGIPAAAVVDLDIIKNRDFNDLLASAFVPPELVSSCNDLRSKIDAKFTELGVDMKRDGIAALPREQREAAETLISNVADYGVFVVPTGELERWFAQLHDKVGRPGKNRWVPWVFGLMNDEPTLFETQEGDIWDFIRKVGDWISDPERKGIPA